MRDFAEDLKTLQLEADEIKDDFSYKSSQLTNSLFICEILTEMRQEMKEMRRELAEIQEKLGSKEAISTRKKFVGEWKMIEHDNFEASKKHYTWSLELFSQNLKFEFVDGKLKQTGGGYKEFIEANEEKKPKIFQVEGDRMKSIWRPTSTIEYHIENGKLHVIQIRDGDSWKRIYEKV